MDISKEEHAGHLELKLSGRLDSYWAEYVATEIEECIRGGTHHIRVNMAGVSYVSSAGVRILLLAYKKLLALQGSFAVVSPSDNVMSVLALSGLTSLCVARPESVEPTGEAGGEKRASFGPLLVELYRSAAEARLSGRTVGETSSLEPGRREPTRLHEVALPVDVQALGIGAFASPGEESGERQGEFLAAGGVAICQPTDRSGLPDYQICSGPFVPTAQLLYGVLFQGKLSSLVRFERAGDVSSVGLSRIVEAVLELTSSDLVGFVMAAESAGLIGAALRRSPLAPDHGSPSLFDHPGVRRVLSFAPEHTHIRDMVVVVGVASRKAAPPSLESFLRPLGKEAFPTGHFHAAVLPYVPLPRGKIDLHDTLHTAFDSSAPKAVLHLLRDDRDIVGGGESEFVRGAVWVGKLAMEMGPMQEGRT